MDFENEQLKQSKDIFDVEVEEKQPLRLSSFS
jgi:hypothetical protein